MTYEIQEECSEELEEEIERTHSDLATEHGRDNVFVTAAGGEVVSIVGSGVGTIDPLQVAVGSDSNQAE
ncbi:hypothetical protein [Halosimplex pelagicum]|jgi:hypothetical protein|uniref:Uncharacterized protein n=1 Tax=Halosimplex pelagicum TaxID=869886 RepID=A0A7D5P972_9EURY|nr:hypothetical protein [Halosimplex pelagicum]QLH82381.1 hypothetical protein HZS54_12470 [Halosimplex pelagicum]